MNKVSAYTLWLIAVLLIGGCTKVAGLGDFSVNDQSTDNGTDTQTEQTDQSCSPGCLPELQFNNKCDSVCNNMACDFDGGACQECAPGCTVNLINNGICDLQCVNQACERDNGACDNNPPCAPGCDISYLGDGVADIQCNVADCFFDGGDIPIQPDTAGTDTAGTDTIGPDTGVIVPVCEQNNNTCYDCAKCARETECQQLITDCVNDNDEMCYQINECVISTKECMSDLQTQLDCIKKCITSSSGGSVQAEQLYYDIVRCTYCNSCPDFCDATVTTPFCDATVASGTI